MLDWLDGRLRDLDASPSASVLVFALLFFLRLALDRWERRRAERRRHHHKGKANG